MGMGRMDDRHKVSQESVFGDTPPDGILVGFMCDNRRHSTCKYLGKWADIAKYNLILWFFYVYFYIQNNNF